MRSWFWGAIATANILWTYLLLSGEFLGTRNQVIKVQQPLSDKVQSDIVPQKSVTSYDGPPKYIHIYWGGPTMPRIVIGGIKSAVITQNHATILIWTPDENLETTKAAVAAIMKWQCASGAKLDVFPISVLAKQIPSAKDPAMHKCLGSLDRAGNQVTHSDLFRFVVLYFYGGIYVDADTFFMKDFAPFQGLEFAFQWGAPERYFNTAIMGLNKYSTIPGRIINATGRCDQETFYPTRVHERLGCNGPCKDFIMMPANTFDGVQDSGIWYNHTGDSPFEKRSLGLEHFYPSSYAYHWHNRWQKHIDPQSNIADLLAKYDKCEL